MRVVAVDGPAARGLVQRCASGDPEARAELYRRSYPALRRFLDGMRLGLPRDQVDDAVQETYLRLFGNLAKVDPTRPLIPWVLGIARLVALETGRRVKRAAAPESSEDVVSNDDPVPGLVSRAEERALVAQALVALEPHERTVIVLRHVVGLSMKELAESLGCSAPTARAHLQAAGHLFALELRRRGLVPGRSA